MRLSDALRDTSIEPVAEQPKGESFRLSEALSWQEPVVEKSKKRGFGDEIVYFLGETAKGVTRGIVSVPASVESMWQVGLDQVQSMAKKQLISDGAVFGASEESFVNRTPEQRRRIAVNNNLVEGTEKAKDNSKRLQQNWVSITQKDGIAPDPALFRGSFMDNPSWTRAVVLGVQSVPMLGLAAAITAATKSPVAGATILGAMEAADEYNIAKEKGLSSDKALGVFVADTVMLSALETIPLTGFMKGGSLPLRAFRGAVQEGGEEVVQGLWKDSIAKIGYDETRSLTENMVESFIAGSLSGGIVGAMTPADGMQKRIENAVAKGVDVEKMMDAVSTQVIENADKITDKFVETSIKPSVMKAYEITTQQESINDATSVISYVKDGKKYFTRLSSSELSNLENEVKNIPEPSNGESQIHLDAITDNLLRVGKEISRDEFISGHSQASGVFSKAIIDNKADAFVKSKEMQVIPELPQPPTQGQESDKTRGLSISIESDTIKEGLVKDLGDLPTYQSRNMDDIATRVSEFINKDYALAKRIALGEAQEQDGLRSQELYTGIRIKATMEGDVDTLRDLAMSEQATAMATELGQRIKALDAGVPEDPVAAIRSLKKSRTDVVEKKVGKAKVKSEIKSTITQVKESTKKAAKKMDWAGFVASLEC